MLTKRGRAAAVADFAVVACGGCGKNILDRRAEAEPTSIGASFPEMSLREQFYCTMANQLWEVLDRESS